MAIGTCDPATRGDPYNQVTLAQGNGQIVIDVRYGWDGVSVKPFCEGPLVNGTGAGNVWAVKVVNNDTISWYAHFVGRKGTPRTLELVPGMTGKYTAAQAAAAGYPNYGDIEGITLTTSPTG